MLDIQFAGAGPDCWRVRSAARGSLPGVVVDSELRKRSVRQGELPAWVQTLFVDQWKAHQIKFCKKLAPVHRFVAPLAHDANSSGLSARRRAGKAEALHAYEPDALPSSVWDALGLHRSSLPGQ